jgi:hypothetical protein
MAANSGLLSPDKISEKEFNALLEQYPAVIQTISAAKPGMSALNRASP